MARKKTPGSIARSIDRSYLEAKKQIEDAMSQCEPGSAAYLNHVKALYEISTTWRTESARGVDPQSLGIAMKPSYEWVCTIAESGETIVQTAEDLEIRRKLDEEFGDLPAAKFNDPEGSGPAPAPAVIPAPRPGKPAPAKAQITKE